MNPPVLARRLLERFLPPTEREAIIGDIDEEFRRYVVPSRGAKQARFWYWRQAILSIPAAMELGARIRRRPRQNGEERRARSLVAGMVQDLRYAIRLARRDPGVTAAAVSTHALAIAVATAVVTLAYIVLLRPLPYLAPDKLVHFFESDSDRPRSSGSFSHPDFVELRARVRAFERVSAYSGGSRTLTGAGIADRVPMTEVSDGFFETLGVPPLHGRTFGPVDSAPGAPPVAILSHGAWIRRFGGRSTILEDRILLNDVPHSIIGVMPPSFEFALRGMTELWLPLRPSRPQLERRYWHWLDVIGRVRSEATMEQAREDAIALSRQVAIDDPKWHAAAQVRFEPLRDRIVGDVRPALLALLGAVSLMLLASCASVTGLFIARWSSRAHEMGIRAAIGASRGQLLRQRLTESLLIGVCGSVLGLAAGHWLLRRFVASLPMQHRMSLPHHEALTIDVGTAIWVVSLSTLAALITGALPAVRAARMEPSEPLQRSGRSSSPAGQGKARSILVTCQVALAVVLLVGAALLGRSTWRLLQVSPGFDTEQLLTMRVNLPEGRYPSAAAEREFHAQLLDRFAAIPGVLGAATINQLPLTGRGNSGTVSFDRGGSPGDPADRSVAIRTVSPNYFEVMGIPLVQGRKLEATDRDSSPPTVVVNQAFVRRFSSGAQLLGRRVMLEFFRGNPQWEIVGTVGDEQFEALDRAPVPVVYFPFAQNSGGAFSVVLRTAGDPTLLAAAARNAIADLDDSLPLFMVRPMEQIIAESEPVFLRRQVLALLVLFGAAALVVSASGLYGVLAQVVAQQRREIGLRLALGATTGEVARMVLGRGLRPAVIGLFAGLALASLAGRGLRTLLFDVSAVDPVSMGAVSVVLAGVAVVSCLVPTLRALRVDPATALKQE